VEEVDEVEEVEVEVAVEEAVEVEDNRAVEDAALVAEASEAAAEVVAVEAAVEVVARNKQTHQVLNNVVLFFRFQFRSFCSCFWSVGNGDFIRKRSFRCIIIIIIGCGCVGRRFRC
jgi:hypothetical protein